jgi:hypothetical protein
MSIAAEKIEPVLDLEIDRELSLECFFDEVDFELLVLHEAELLPFLLFKLSVGFFDEEELL